MTRYKVELEYDGTNLIGWQENLDGPSVQSVMMDAIEQFCGARPTIFGAGRTDSGVHSVCMTAHFDLDTDYDANTVMRALNFYLLNKPVSVLSCDVVPDDFHARFSCTARHYKYVVLNRGAAPVLEKNRVYWFPQKLDVEKMRLAAQKLLGQHDFTSFRATQCQAKSPIKTLDQLDITVDGDHIIFELSARSFLHHMVRNIVGTLLEIGAGKPYDIDQVLAAKNRTAAGPTAPASGLYFIRASYSTND
ncbi:MAG: tRNA pseudouridine(38-40) synthase TruA [Alphaproteobacteria bacterium]|nr:tRNA pseudouridine(38-40) synthase TruA [Alphaproteobacteria bacterium]